MLAVIYNLYAQFLASNTLECTAISWYAIEFYALAIQTESDSHIFQKWLIILRIPP